MKRLILAVFLLAGGMLSPFALASFETPPWSTCTGDGSYSDFDTCEISFPAVTVGQLASINNPGGGYYHTHGNNSAVHSLEVHLNGSWVAIWSVTGASGDQPIAGISTPITFAKGSVDGIRFTVNPVVSNGYHSVNGAMTFSLGEPEHVPTLPAGALLALVLAMAGIGMYGRRRSLHNRA